MLHINLITDTSAIVNPRLLELFRSKIEYLSGTLAYYDRKGILATVTINGQEVNHRLSIYAAVYCKDAEFKNTIESMVVQNSHTQIAETP